MPLRLHPGDARAVNVEVGLTARHARSNLALCKAWAREEDEDALGVRVEATHCGWDEWMWMCPRRRTFMAGGGEKPFT